MSTELRFRGDLEGLGAFWQYSGGRYLALLTSGLVSDTFVNIGAMATRPRIFTSWCGALVEKMMASTAKCQGDRVAVIGPGMGAITAAYNVAWFLDKFGHKDYHALFTEPVVGDGQKAQKMRFDTAGYDSVILVEDVLTTGTSVMKTYSALPPPRPPVVCVDCFVDRREIKESAMLLWRTDNDPQSDANAGSNAPVVSLLQVFARTWKTLDDARKDCPNVIEAIKPKANWKQLVTG